jgi:hypothetical protein
MSRAAVAFCLLAAARRHPDGEASAALGPQFTEKVQAITGVQAFETAQEQLGTTRTMPSSV